MEIPVGIVLFNPELKRLEENINSIYEKASGLIINDNGSDNINEIENLLLKYDKAVLIKNEKNLGIAAALNIICTRAISLGYECILTLDQDSVCPENLFDEYLSCANVDKIGIICPTIKDRNYNLNKRTLDSGIEEISKCITSGSLIFFNAWHDVNGFDENMFIDGVDFDFCARIRRKGYKILRNYSVVLLHEIGKTELRRFIFWKVRVKNHSAFRKYYISKNIIYLARKSGRKSLIIKSYLQMAKQYILVLLYEDNKKQKLHEIIKGANDGKHEVLDEKWL